ncbi:MAG: NUDIX domain-containing protein [Acidimicrobiia bacterium]|nr:NUDIX domain-containing protein [Acidimicrobiia bacterium]
MVEMGGELVEVVAADGTVERVVTRAEMRGQRLQHRGVGVVVRRPGDGAVRAHQRAAWKDVWPSYWDLAFGGVCGVGETYEASAVRELAEEAGVEVTEADLRFLAAGLFEDDAVALVARVYEIDHAGPFTFADGEVERSEWVARAELDDWAAARQVVPDTLSIGLERLRIYSSGS